MNDRFKFRTFLKYNQIMCDIDSYCFLQGLNKCVFHFTNGGQKTLKNDDFILMQCTGLKDKNGKLIYEGDIVRFKDCNDILVINYQKEIACFAPQFYCNGKYGGRLWFDDYDSFECQFYKSNNFEVIGNIYENKELLESEG